MLERVIVAVDGAKMEAEEVEDENYVRYVDATLFPFLEAELEKARDRSMNEQERRLYDARADHEGWSLAHEILEPWVQATRLIGSDELTRVMEKALADVEGEVNRTLDVLEPLQRGKAS
jgi:DNA-binding transcriptional regulator YbjK